ncbi:MAG: hypothetical protein D6694_00895 [Gammaproteobacteria bacterium]|nr:MAG: hypothetical protein D6694_00895 [Gammaproteobacteria bacterium]
MRKWIYHRAKEMLDELNELPFSDDVDDKKLAIIRRGLRDASMELFRRAAERTVKELEDGVHLELIREKKKLDDILKEDD